MPGRAEKKRRSQFWLLGLFILGIAWLAFWAGALWGAGERSLTRIVSRAEQRVASFSPVSSEKITPTSSTINVRLRLKSDALDEVEQAMATPDEGPEEQVTESAYPAQSEAEELRKEIEALKVQLESINRQLVEARLEAAEYRSVFEQSAMMPTVEALATHAVERGDWLLVDVDAEKGLAAMAVGSLHGVKPQLPCLALREGVLVAKLNVVEVRERISALAVKETFVEGFVEAGDRVIPESQVSGGE